MQAHRWHGRERKPEEACHIPHVPLIFGGRERGSGGRR